MADPIKPAPPVTNTRIRFPLSTSVKASRFEHERRRHFLQSRLLPVLVGKPDAGGIDRPSDAKGSVVPFEAPIAIRGVVIGDLVDHLGIGLKRTISMRKARRNPYLGPVFGAQNRAHMLSVSRRTDPDIDGHIED